jgi:hypothetical protein
MKDWQSLLTGKAARRPRSFLLCGGQPHTQYNWIMLIHFNVIKTNIMYTGC